MDVGIFKLQRSVSHPVFVPSFHCSFKFSSLFGLVNVLSTQRMAMFWQSMVVGLEGHSSN